MCAGLQAQAVILGVGMPPHKNGRKKKKKKKLTFILPMLPGAGETGEQAGEKCADGEIYKP